jgi:hypothetical protein
VVYHHRDAEKIEKNYRKGHQHGRNLCPRIAEKIYRHWQGVNNIIRAEGAYYQDTAFFPVPDGKGEEDPEKRHHEKNAQGTGAKQPGVEFGAEVYGYGTVEKMEGQKIPETETVEKGNILPADMISELHKPSQRYGKEHGKNRVKAEQQNTHATPLLRTAGTDF